MRYEAEDLDLILPDDGIELPTISHVETLAYENALVGVNTGEHPIALYRDWLDAHGILTVPHSRAANMVRSSEQQA